MKKPPQELYAIPIKVLQEICHISLKTALRWKDGTTCPPWASLQWLNWKRNKNLGTADSEWSGWVLRDGRLISPEGIAATTGDVLSIPFMNSQVAAYRAENQRLRDELDDLTIENQPLPDEEVPAIILSGIAA